MKRKTSLVVLLASLGLIGSAISFAPHYENFTSGGIEIEDAPRGTSGPVFYPAEYSTSITNEPQFQTQNSYTFGPANFVLAPSQVRGDSVKVAVIDSGINYSHEDFPTINSKSRSVENNSGWKYYEYSSFASHLMDSHGHGTNVASVIASQINAVGCAGIAPNVDLYIYKVTNSQNGYEWTAIINALQYCIDEGMDVVNMSFQAYEHAVSYNGGSMGASSGCSSVLASKLTEAHNAGITLVGAAGNYNTNEPSYPASNNYVISVGSLAESSKTDKAGYSNTYGIDLVAPGTVEVASLDSNSSYKKTSGTSFSAPVVTAAIALYKQLHPTATPAQIEEALYASCDQINGTPSWAGNGRLNIDNFLGLTEEEEEDDPVLDHLVVSSNHRDFTTKDSFVKENVTAVLDDGTEFDVTYSATFSGYNLSYAGEQTVSVSYTYGDVTKSTSYKITVTDYVAPAASEDYGDYYKTISDSDSGSSLLTALRSLNLTKRTKTVGYSEMGTTTSGKFKFTDYDPDSNIKYENGVPYGDKILSFYSGRSCTSWNREHVWPNSRGGGSGGDAGSPYPDADIYMPRPTITEENSNRGNSVYVEGMCHSSNGWDPVTAFEDSLGVYTNIRGECARIIFYCMTVNANLVLNEKTGNDGNNMGLLTDLLEWNLKYPVNDRETRRQVGGEYLQGNRNAFVDHPDYACKIWGDTSSATQQICSSITPPTTKKLVSLTKTGTPTKTEYIEGQNFDPTGLTVTATYDDDSSETVTNKVSWSPSPLTKGTTQVVGTYSAGGVSKSFTITGLTTKEGTVPTTGDITITDADIPSAYNASGVVSITKDGATVKFDASNVANYLNGIQFKSSNGYISNQNGLNISSIELVTRGSQKFSGNLYWGDSANPSGNSVSATNGNTYANPGTYRFFKLKVGSNAGYLDKLIVHLSEAENVPVTGVSLSSSSLSLNVGQSQTLTATIAPDNATNKSVTWESSNQSVATVNNGQVSAVGIGTATITVKTVDGNKTATCSVTVSAAPVISVTGVSLSPTSLTLNIGQTSTLTPTVLPSNATNKNVTWGSSNNNVATVANGVVTAKAKGSATITVYTVDGNKTATCSVTVNEVPFVNSIEQCYSKNDGDSAGTIYGTYVGSYNNGQSSMIMNGEYGIMLYYVSPEANWKENETHLKVTGMKISVYKNLYELKTASGYKVTEVTDANEVAQNILPVVTYSVKGTESTSDLTIANRLSTITGTVKTGSITVGSDSTITMNVNSNSVPIFVKSKSATQEVKNFFDNAGTTKQITIQGFTGFYTTFQIQFKGCIEESTTYFAEDFAQDLLDLTAEVCALSQSSGWADVKSALSPIWVTLEGADYYAKLPAAQKAVLSEATADESGTVIEEAMARYDHIVGRYRLNNFISGRTIAYSNFSLMEINGDKTVPLIVIVSVIGMAAIGGYFFYKKRKEN